MSNGIITTVMGQLGLVELQLAPTSKDRFNGGAKKCSQPIRMVVKLALDRPFLSL